MGRAPRWVAPQRGLTLGRWLRSARLELGLHFRLAAVGLWRGISAGGGILGSSRLSAMVIHHSQACDRAWQEAIKADKGGVRVACDCPRERLGLISTKVITDAGVAFLVDDWDNNGQDLTTMNFHGCGTGAAAEAVGDTALGTESTTALNPDNTRATGTRSQPAANQYRTVGTLTFDASAAVTEHGIFNQSATGGGTLWDRSVFSAINVANLDSIQFTYTCTVSSGG